MNIKFLKSFGIIVLALVMAFGAKQYFHKIEEDKKEMQAFGTRNNVFAAMVSQDNEILQYFTGRFPQRKVILACEEDITNDQLKDLLVIYEEAGHIRLVAVCGNENEIYHVSQEIPAPVENQTIQFKNIDKEAEVEFIISGEKKGAVGYAIYRMIDGEIKDLFGDGMNDCC